MSVQSWRLGLIGANIAETRSPTLHALCALAVGGNATYDLIIPAERGMGLAALLDHCAGAGFHGVNVTYPHKEEAAALVAPGTAATAAIGSANTVRFGPGGARAFNTDATGFVAAFRARWPGAAPGRVLVLGSGGAGRAVAFGLAALGATELVLADAAPGKAGALAAALGAAHPAIPCRTVSGPPADLDGFDGVVNCTPLGMAGRPGSPLAEGTRGRPAWAFDAVYTPGHTPFRARTEALGAAFLPGWELYFHQGIEAFEIFTGCPVEDRAWLRAVLTRRG